MQHRPAACERIGPYPFVLNQFVAIPRAALRLL
jgi:hypothetical protein